MLQHTRSRADTTSNKALNIHHHWQRLKAAAGLRVDFFLLVALVSVMPLYCRTRFVAGAATW